MKDKKVEVFDASKSNKHTLRKGQTEIESNDGKNSHRCKNQREAGQVPAYPPGIMQAQHGHTFSSSLYGPLYRSSFHM